MAKLRKMLGDINDPTIITLMKLIETQSADTLGKWSVNYVADNLLDIYKLHFPSDQRLDLVIKETNEYLSGNKTIKEQKLLLKNAKDIIKDIETDMIALAVVRAVLTACATKYNLTNALGFTFYTCAALVYHKVGLLESRETYDNLARDTFINILSSLEAVAVDHEENPVKVKWNC